MDKTTVVLYPGLGGIGHLTPMVQLAQLFVQHGVALVKPQEEPASSFSAAVALAAATNPSVTFHVLPPPAPADEAPRDMSDYLRLMDAPLRDLLRSLPAVRALVLDMFCAGSLDVAAELDLPAYFFASGTSFLAVFLSLPRTMAGMDRRSFAELEDAPFRIPVAPPFKPTDFPKLSWIATRPPSRPTWWPWRCVDWERSVVSGLSRAIGPAQTEESQGIGAR